MPLRLRPGQDLREALLSEVATRGCTAAFVLGGIGSLSHATLRLAGAAVPQVLSGDIELLTLSGTLAADGRGVHLHACLATADGSVLGGHLGRGCVVRTTAEILLVGLPGWSFRREPDPQTGFDELVVKTGNP